MTSIARIITVSASTVIFALLAPSANAIGPQPIGIDDPIIPITTTLPPFVFPPLPPPVEIDTSWMTCTYGSCECGTEVTYTYPQGDPRNILSYSCTYDYYGHPVTTDDSAACNAYLMQCIAFLQQDQNCGDDGKKVICTDDNDFVLTYDRM